MKREIRNREILDLNIKACVINIQNMCVNVSEVETLTRAILFAVDHQIA